MSEETNVNEQQNNEPQESSFDISSLNETLGEGFSFEDVGSLKERLTKFDELNSQVETFSKEKSEWENKYKETSDKYQGILNHFSQGNVIENLYGSKDTWERVQLEKKFADKDIDAVNKVYKSDLNSMNEIDAILLADKLKYKANISDEDRKSAILTRMGIEDGNLQDLDASQKYSLSVATAEAKELLSGIKSFKPEEPSFAWLEEANASQATMEEKSKALTDGWTQAVTDSLTAYTGSKAFSKDGDKLEELISYEADDKFKTELLPQAIKDFASQGLDPSKEENLKMLSTYIDNQHKLYAFDKIVKKATELAITKTQDAAHEEIHSDTPKNTNEAPPVKSDVGVTYREYLANKNK